MKEINEININDFMEGSEIRNEIQHLKNVKSEYPDLTIMINEGKPSEEGILEFEETCSVTGYTYGSQITSDDGSGTFYYWK